MYNRAAVMLELGQRQRGCLLDRPKFKAEECCALAGAAASTAVLINRQGTPLNGAIYWAIQAGFGGGKYAAKIASQGCAHHSLGHCTA